MRGHRACDVRIVGDAGGAGIARPAVGLRRGAGGDGGAQEAMQAVGREILDDRQTDTPRSLLLHLDRTHLDRTGDEDFTRVAAPTTTAAERVVPAPAGKVRLVHLD